MKSNAERMNLVFARAKKIKYCRETKKLNFCKVATALLSVLLLCCTALFPTSYKSAAVAGYCGAILLIDGMGGFMTVWNICRPLKKRLFILYTLRE